MLQLPTVVLICCTYNRHYCLRRALRNFLDQDYIGHATLLIYNSGESLELGEFDIPDTRTVILINNKMDRETGEPYASVGAKYRDAVNSAPSATLFNSYDDDDLRLPSFITQNVKGWIKAGKKAYKPYHSFFRTRQEVVLAHNTLEPSIFVTLQHVKEHGFNEVSVLYHQKWLDPLTQNDEIFVDPQGTPTFIYNWGDQFDTYKLSGRGVDDADNYNAHAILSVDKGDGTLTPIPTEEMQNYYNEIYLLSGRK